ncbi:MAG: hypothetical protein NTV51_14640 [Verrucomicrobia bacterium]|nr:hypothetical protein [Verrucomicrobiota bacterium]
MPLPPYELPPDDQLRGLSAAFAKLLLVSTAAGSWFLIVLSLPFTTPGSRSFVGHLDAYLRLGPGALLAFLGSAISLFGITGAKRKSLTWARWCPIANYSAFATIFAICFYLQ